MDPTAVAEVGSGPDWDAMFGAPTRRRRRTPQPGGVWADLAAAGVAPPRLRTTVEAREVPVRWGDDYVVVGDAARRRHFRLEPWEWTLTQQMDGTRSVEELVSLRFDTDGAVDPDAVRDLVTLLRQGDLLEGAHADVWRAVADAVAPTPTRWKRAGRALASLSIEWTGAERFVTRAYQTLLKPLFAPSVQPILAVIAVAGLVAFGWMAANGQLTLHQGTPLAGALLIVISLAMTFVHELGHAAYLVHRGRRVYGAGFMLYFGSPAFFVDSTDGLLLDRRERIKQAFAGPYYELVIGGLMALVALVVPPGFAADVLRVSVLLLYFGVFLNLIPLLELDGYFIFAELLEAPALRAQSFQFVRHELPTRIRRRLPLRGHEIAFTAYVMVGTAFTVWSVWVAAEFWWTLFGPMVTGLWNAGTVGRVVLVVASAALAGPAIQGAAKLTRNMLAKATRRVADVKFHFETAWRVEAALLLDESPVFGDLPEAALNDLAGRVDRRRFATGESVFRQGDRAEAFYVVRSGTLDVVSEGASGHTVMATLQRGDTFGELGLLGHGIRQATVRATSAAEIFRIREGDFDRLVRSDASLPDVAPTLTALTTLATLPPFARLTSSRLAALHRSGTWVDVAPGQTVVRQGEPGDAFYVIAAGRVDVTQGRRHIRQMGPGESFGELALQRAAPRSATVTAATPLRLFRVPPPAFRRFLAADHRPRYTDEPQHRVMHH